MTMNKRITREKGFTLIELIGVIAVLAIILMVSLPALSKMLKKYDEQKYETVLKDLYLATEQYTWNFREYFPTLENINGEATVSFKTLKEAGYIRSRLENPKTKKYFLDTDYILVHVNGDHTRNYLFNGGSGEIPSVDIVTPTYTITPSADTWAQEKTVTIHYQENKQPNFVYEYSKDGGSSWEVSYETEKKVLYHGNGTIIARVRDLYNDQNTVTARAFTITKIDTTKPTTPTFTKYRETIPLSKFSYVRGASLNGTYVTLPNMDSHMEVKVYNHGADWKVYVTATAGQAGPPGCTAGQGCILMGTIYYDKNGNKVVATNGYDGNGLQHVASQTTPTVVDWDGYAGFSRNMEYILYNLENSPEWSYPTPKIYSVEFELNRPPVKSVSGGKEVTIQTKDTESGIKEIHYSTNQSTWTKASFTIASNTAKVIVPGEGDYYFRVMDHVGNISSASGAMLIRTNDNGLTSP